MMVNELMVTIIRTTLGFSLLLLITRIIGNKQLGQLNIFTYISGVAIGNMAGDMIIHRDVTLFDALSGMILWGVFTLLSEYMSLKNARARAILDGEPVIVIKKGEIIYESLKKERLNIDDLTMLLRTKNIFSIADVDYAILEPNGELSVLKKPGKENITKGDMSIPVTPLAHLPTEVIVDGNIVVRNLKEVGLTYDKLLALLQQYGIDSPETILYGELQGDGSLYIQLK